jgi:hypothetical protein
VESGNSEWVFWFILVMVLGEIVYRAKRKGR